MEAAMPPILKYISTALLLPALAVPLLSHAQAGPMPPGEYRTDQGWGTLEIKPAAGGKQAFTIDAIGANAHTCSLDGTIQDHHASVDTGAPGPRCEIDFHPKGGGFDIDSKTNEACRAFCGARASYDGLYLKPPAGCTTAEIKKTRADFAKLYAAKDYAGAQAALAPVIAHCASMLWTNEDGQIRNDLAVTYHHLGKSAECRKVLEPLRELAEQTDDDIKGGYPPADAENNIAIARPTRTNLKLCRK